MGGRKKKRRGDEKGGSWEGGGGDRSPASPRSEAAGSGHLYPRKRAQAELDSIPLRQQHGTVPSWVPGHPAPQGSSSHSRGDLGHVTKASL